MSKNVSGPGQADVVRIQFGPFTLDLATRQVVRGTQPLHLTPKAFDLLTILIHERPTVLSKRALQERLWPDTFVAEANLSNLVAEIREALDDRARAPQFIRTAHGFGYAFCGDAAPVAASRDAAIGPVCWLEWDRQRFPLSVGEHVIGRDPDVDVRLDRSTVSRRHARVLVTAETAMLEDFGSKNGTFRGHERLTAAVALLDGDSIGIGSLLITFRRRAVSLSTDTQT
jgi:DNA-binding winged helix-turn-helix (wHTH) protein